MAETTRKKRGGARTAAIIELPTEGAGEDATPPKTEAERAADEQIDNAVEKQAPQPEALVYRADPSTGKEAFLDRVSPEFLSEEWLGKEYGGGKYRVQIRKPGADGRLVYGKQLRYEVDPSIPAKSPRWARAAAASGPISNADGSPASPPLSAGMDAVLQSGILSLFTQMQNANQMQLEFMKRMNEDRTSPKGPDFVSLLTAVTPLLAPIISGLLERKDPMELATKLLELRGDRAPAGETNVMKTVKEVLEIREMFSGGGGVEGGPDPLLRLVETIAPQLIDTFKQAMQLDAARAGVPIPPGAPATASRTVAPSPSTPALSASRAHPAAMGSAQAAGEPAPTTGDAPVEAWKMLVGQRIPKIISLAEKGKNPVLYAQLEEDIIPEIFKPAAREFVSNDNFVELIYAEYPQLRVHQEWMDEFFDVFAGALLGELEEGGDDEADIVYEEEDVSARAQKPNILREPIAEGPDTIPPATDNGTVD